LKSFLRMFVKGIQVFEENLIKNTSKYK